MAVTDSKIDRATESGCSRTLLVLPLWAVRLLVQGPGERPPQVGTLLVDALLVALHLWAVWPLVRALPGRYPDRSRFSAQYWTPVIVAGFLLLRDLYCWVSDTAL